MLVHALVDPLQRGLSEELILRTRTDSDLEDHEAILAAIDQRDGPAAGRAMRTHLDAVEDVLLGEVE
jgi:DNA-binding FadR family transcriptional regulator